MTKTAKKIPSFKNEVEERKFWESHDSSEFLDWTQAKQVALPNLKPTTKTISLSAKGLGIAAFAVNISIGSIATEHRVQRAFAVSATEAFLEIKCTVCSD